MTSSFSPTTISAAADRLRKAHEERATCEPVTDLLHGASIDDAYAVQNINTERWLDDGRRLVGRKIGLTSTVVQKQLGVNQPDYGMLFADMAADEGGEIGIGRLMQPRAEAEIAFVLGRDLPDPDTTTAEILRAIDFAVIAIEMVSASRNSPTRITSGSSRIAARTPSAKLGR